jgi:uncharacterized protein (TIGR02270 family)
MAEGKIRKAEVLQAIVRQHAEEVGFLWSLRDTATHAFDYDLREIEQLDERVDAHLEGLRCAGAGGLRACEGLLAEGRPGDLFAPTILALESEDAVGLRRLIALAEAAPVLQRSMFAAFGWVSARLLSGVVAPMLESDSAFERRLALACCSFHRVSPGQSLVSTVSDEDDSVRGRALRIVGEIGVAQFADAIIKVARDDVTVPAFWAAWSAVLLGDRRQALDRLAEASLTPGPHRWRALQLAVIAHAPDQRRSLLKRIATAIEDPKLLAIAAGLSGDSYYVPWLISQMKVRENSQVAGLAVSMITGVDLRAERLDLIAGPSPTADTSGDPLLVDDQHLPMPDEPKVATWWSQASQGFPVGVPHLNGERVTREHCIDVLRKGTQLQRIVAAQYLCLLNPGTPLFNTSAPAWRQQTLLMQM